MKYVAVGRTIYMFPNIFDVVIILICCLVCWVSDGIKRIYERIKNGSEKRGNRR